MNVPAHVVFTDHFVYDLTKRINGRVESYHPFGHGVYNLMRELERIRGGRTREFVILDNEDYKKLLENQKNEEKFQSPTKG